MDLRREVEGRERELVLSYVMRDEPFFVLGDHLGPCLQPDSEEIPDAKFMDFSFSRREALVGSRVAEVVSESHLDVFICFDDGRTQILVALYYEKVFLVP